MSAFANSLDGSTVFAAYYSPSWHGILELSAGGTVRHRIFTMAGPEDQTALGAFDGRWLVWTVAHSFTHLNDQDAYAWDSQSGAVIHIASTPHVGGLAIEGPLLSPVVLDGIAAWTQSTTSGTTQLHFENLQTRVDNILTGDTPGSPLFARPYLVWENRVPIGGSILAFASAATGKRVPTPVAVAGIPTPQFIGGASGVFAFTDRDARSMWVWQFDQPAPVKVYDVPLGDYAEFPTLSDDGVLLVWPASQSSWIANLRTKVVTQLLPTPGTVVIAHSTLTADENVSSIKENFAPAHLYVAPASRIVDAMPSCPTS